MTDAEWLASGDPQVILRFLRGIPAATDRKYRLFACACCRRAWNRLPAPENRALVEAVENNPGGTFGDPDIHAAGVASSSREWEFREDPAYWVAKYLGRGFYKLSAALSAAVVSAMVLSLPEPAAAQGVRDALAFQRQAQVALLRDIFANPFRPVAFDPVWRTSTAAALAAQMYESRDFGAMPILADALQDAGCDNADILDHCREGVAGGDSPPASQRHARGCWVVDLVLGKT